jgi:hypothetical protein
MTCEHVRELIGADPFANDSDVAQHVSGCADCATYQREMHTMESAVRRALQTPPVASAREGPPAVSTVVSLEAARNRGSLAAPAPAARIPDWKPAPLWLAIAASVALLSGVLGFALLANPSAALARDLAEHMGGEADSWDQPRAVPQSALEFVLRQSGVRVSALAAADIVYAHSCFFRGRNVPHLVVRTDQGPVTVLVLAREPVESRERFREGPFEGWLLPAEPAAAAQGEARRPALALLARAGGATPLAEAGQLDALLQRLAPVLVEPPRID